MRTHLRLGASLLAILVCAAGSAGADVYRWTDENGQLHFTSDLSQVPARYRDQAATPAESKATFNEVEVPEASGAAPASPAPTQAAPQPAAKRSPVPRIRTDGPAPSKSRMAEFEAEEKAAEEASAPAPSGPQKYIRDCTNSNGGRCKSWVNPEWRAWNEQRKATEAAADAEE